MNGRRVRGGLELMLASVMDGARLRSGIRHVLRVRLSRASRALPMAERESP